MSPMKVFQYDMCQKIVNTKADLVELVHKKMHHALNTAYKCDKCQYVLKQTWSTWSTCRVNMNWTWQLIVNDVMKNFLHKKVSKSTGVK